MPFDIKGFVTNENFIGAVDGMPIREHRYVSNDVAATIEAAGYFNTLRDKGLVRKGDLLVVLGGRSGVPFASSYVLATVPAIGGGNVALTEHKAVTQNATQEIFLAKTSTKAADAEVFRYVPNQPGRITKVRSVLNAALATADATLIVKINGVNVTDGTLTLPQAASAAGNVAVATPSALNTYAAGDVISVTTGGGSTATGTANVSLELRP